MDRLHALAGVCAGIIVLSGCATTAEVDTLRVEVDKANATAARNKAEVARLERELKDLKEEKAEAPAEPAFTPKVYSSPTATRASGYKWGTVRTRPPD